MIGWCWPVLTSIGPTLTQHSVCLLNCFGIQVVGIYIEGWGMFCVNSRLHTMSVVYNPNWTEILSHVNPRFHTLSVMLESGITMRRFSPCMWWWKKLLLCKMSCGKNVHATVNLHNWTTRRQMVEVSHRTNTTQHKLTLAKFILANLGGHLVFLLSSIPLMWCFALQLLNKSIQCYQIHANYVLWWGKNPFEYRWPWPSKSFCTITGKCTFYWHIVKKIALEHISPFPSNLHQSIVKERILGRHWPWPSKSRSHNLLISTSLIVCLHRAGHRSWTKL